MSVSINDISDYANIVACVLTKQKDRNKAWVMSKDEWLKMMQRINNHIIDNYNSRYGHVNDNPIVWDDLLDFDQAWEKYDDIDNVQYQANPSKAYHDLKIIVGNVGTEDTGVMLHWLFGALTKVTDQILLTNNLEIYYVN